jgi:cytochrome c-type biogenesis protein CcmH
MRMPAFAAAGLIVLALLGSAAPAQAADPSEMLKNPAQEQRAEEIGRGLRCLVCQSESIEESNADLARDLRVIVRERIKAGDTDDQIRQFVVARYGDFVLLDPPFKIKTLALWGGPILFLLAGLGILVSFYRRRRAETPPAPLTADEKRRLDLLLKDTGSK